MSGAIPGRVSVLVSSADASAFPFAKAELPIIEAKTSARMMILFIASNILPDGDENETSIATSDLA
jgi:hypothetical protein